MIQVLLGDVGTGKSSLVLRFVKGQFIEFQVRIFLKPMQNDQFGKISLNLYVS